MGRRPRVSVAPDLADQPVPSTWAEAGEPLRVAVVEVAQLGRDCMDLVNRSPDELDAGNDLDYLAGDVDDDSDDERDDWRHRAR